MGNGANNTGEFMLIERPDAQEALDRIDAQLEELSQGIKLERMLHPAGWHRPLPPRD